MILSPDWVAGFVDGEGCFYIGIYKHPEMTVGYQVLPEFRIVQHYKNIKVLYSLKRFFGYGVVRKNHDDRYELIIRDTNQLIKVVEFFQKHPLKTTKNIDFKKFAKVVRWMQEGKHLTKEGLKKIVETAMEMNTQNKESAVDILKQLDGETG